MTLAVFYFILALSILYIAINLLLYNTLARIFNISLNLHFDKNRFSIIVPVKNEKETIAELIESIEKNNYPNTLFELIIVDDNSTDDTFMMLESLKDKYSNLKLYRAGEKIYPAKKGALAVGITRAENPYIIITDGDCKVDKEWIQSYNNKFQDGCELVFGAAPFYQQNSMVNKISCYENLRSSVLTFSAAGLGIPYSAAARNYGFMKSAFLKIGGYKNTLETAGGDDDLLLREAVKNKFKIGVITEKDSAVFSYTKSRLKDYLLQKTRHTKTSLYYLPSRKLVLALFHLFNLLLLFSPVLIFINFNFLFPFLIKIFTDTVLVLKTQRRFFYRFRIYEIVYLQVIYELLIIINFFNALFRKTKWKEED
jgi:glycosyltransferase involved in cell wall biosynthesis